MNNRCPYCNKFVAVELDQPETDNLEVENIGKGKGLFRMTISLTKCCAECGTDLSNKQIEVEIEIDLSGFEPT